MSFPSTPTHKCIACGQDTPNDGNFCKACGRHQEGWQKRAELAAFEDRIAKKTASEVDRLERESLQEMHQPQASPATLSLMWKVFGAFILIGAILFALSMK